MGRVLELTLKSHLQAFCILVHNYLFKIDLLLDNHCLEASVPRITVYPIEYLIRLLTFSSSVQPLLLTCHLTSLEIKLGFTILKFSLSQSPTVISNRQNMAGDFSNSVYFCIIM